MPCTRGTNDRQIDLFNRAIRAQRDPNTGQIARRIRFEAARDKRDINKAV
jgi:hypothetical protein